MFSFLFNYYWTDGSIVKSKINGIIVQPSLRSYKIVVQWLDPKLMSTEYLASSPFPPPPNIQ